VDLRSTNGTFVNGARVEGEAPLRNDDRIEIAEAMLQFDAQRKCLALITRR
jgi:pSer/pThr/pTyr-binding forkhead associated (FHA) protein